MIKKILPIASLFLSLCVNAAPVTYNFEATDFRTFDDLYPVPLSYIDGSFTINGDVITQIDLTIGSHSYTLDEVDIDYRSSGFRIGGVLNGVGAIYGGTDDFYLSINTDVIPHSGGIFEYAMPDMNFSSWSSSVTISVTNIPLPGTGLLYISSLVGMLCRKFFV